jgi:hypothetical protein
MRTVFDISQEAPLSAERQPLQETTQISRIRATDYKNTYNFNIVTEIHERAN